jgi:putative membrane protein insertion efficiency factor
MALIWGYRFTLGPLMGGHCRFWPTCSEYGLEAYRVHGPIRGSYLTVRRICRCHPFGGHGFDPVPEPRTPESASK